MTTLSTISDRTGSDVDERCSSLFDRYLRRDLRCMLRRSRFGRRKGAHGLRHDDSGDGAPDRIGILDRKIDQLWNLYRCWLLAFLGPEVLAPN
jgi:hypothetical protein